MCKMLSFEVLHVEIAQKIQKYIQILAHFQQFLIGFQFLQFFGDVWKRNFIKKVPNKL